MIKLLRNRNFILMLGVFLGLVGERGAQWTEPLTLPALALIMTLSTMGISGKALRSLRSMLPPALAGIGMSYLVLGSFLLVLNQLLIHDPALWVGFVLLAAVPPAVAVIPFTTFFSGDERLSLLGMVGAYLGALVLMPLITLALLGGSFFDPGRLGVIMIELILIPLFLSRVLIRIGFSHRLDRLKGPITNWGFFLLTYTIVGLNREVILADPLFLLPVGLIAVASTFLLGWAIEWIGRLLRLPPSAITSLLLLGTMKNYGLAGGLALALFSKKTSVPATVSSVFMIVYVIWLEFKGRRKNAKGSARQRKAEDKP